MRIVTKFVCIVILIECLTACSGHVVPQFGVTMEQVYDGIRREHHHRYPAKGGANIHSQKFHRQFQKISNPELSVYVFPHFAGQEQVPVPGYYTVFSAYTRDHYALPHETFQG